MADNDENNDGSWTDIQSETNIKNLTTKYLQVLKNAPLPSGPNKPYAKNLRGTVGRNKKRKASPPRVIHRTRVILLKMISSWNF